MIDYTKDNSKRENLIQFIKVTQKLLDEDGLKYLSIRKIATASGFHKHQKCNLELLIFRCIFGNEK